MTTDRTVIIAENQKLYADLKSILARQPGPEVAEQLCVYQQTLSVGVVRSAADCAVNQAQANEYRAEVGKLTGELQDVKRKYLELKRVLQLEREGCRGTKPPTPMTHSSASKLSSPCIKI
jgi:hypothetical protein